MPHQLHGDGEGDGSAPQLPPHPRAADQGGLTAAQEGEGGSEGRGGWSSVSLDREVKTIE